MFRQNCYHLKQKYSSKVKINLYQYESSVYYFIINCFQCFYDLCMVWPSQTTGNESYFQLASIHSHTLFMVYSFSGIFMPDTSKSYWICREWGPFSLMQLKVIQEVITLIIFTIFTTVLFKGESLHWNHFAAFICLIATVYFVFMK